MDAKQPEVAAVAAEVDAHASPECSADLDEEAHKGGLYICLHQARVHVPANLHIQLNSRTLCILLQCEFPLAFVLLSQFFTFLHIVMIVASTTSLDRALCTDHSTQCMTLVCAGLHSREWGLREAGMLQVYTQAL